MHSWVYRLFDRAGNVLLPAQCLLCRAPASVPGRDLCPACEADLPRIEPACGRCGEPIATPAGTVTDEGCAGCRERALPYDRCVAPFAYAFPFDQLIPALKYQAALTHARVFGVLLAEAVARRTAVSPVDVIVPLPLHPTRLVERGYDQAFEIARFVGATLGVRVDAPALRRTRATQAQVGLERAVRMRNVRGAFAADPVRVVGRSVALLDDVITTGSTMAAAAQSVRDAGAARVEAWSVARALA